MSDEISFTGVAESETKLRVDRPFGDWNDGPDVVVELPAPVDDDVSYPFYALEQPLGHRWERDDAGELVEIEGFDPHSPYLRCANCGEAYCAHCGPGDECDVIDVEAREVHRALPSRPPPG